MQTQLSKKQQEARFLRQEVDGCDLWNQTLRMLPTTAGKRPTLSTEGSQSV